FRAYRALGKSADALHVINQVAARTSGEYLVRGKLYETAGEATLALADYEKARELDPGGAPARVALAGFYTNRAAQHMRRNDPRQALADYEWALELVPTHAEAQHRRVGLLFWSPAPVVDRARGLDLAR